MFRLIKFIPHDTKIDFIGKRKLAMLFSVLLVLASIGSYATQGLSYGIDFAGGILLEVQTPGPADIKAMRKNLSSLDLGEVAIQSIGGTDNQVIIRVQRQKGGDAAQQVALKHVRTALGEGMDYRRTETVGPKVGAELVVDGAMAVGFAILAIVAYITFRFEWHFGVGGMIALIHDVITTIGIFSVLGLEFNLTTVAALLTIAGYSINDTVVVYDRVRENMRKYKKMDLSGLLNLSLNETLSRTILTSTTTLLAVVSIYLFGGEVLQGFAFALIWGVVIGTYSSMYIALPVLIFFNYRDEGDDTSMVEKGTKEKPAT